MEKITLNIQSLVKGKQWYNQRFDGSPMFIFAIAEAEVMKEKRKPKGTEADMRVCYFFHGKADWYLDVKDIKRGADAIIKLAQKNPNISTKLLKSWKKDEKKFESFFHKNFPKINLKKLSDQGLAKLWHKSYYLFIKRATSSSVIDHFALGTDELISKMLRKEVFSKVKGFKESDFTEIFAAATAPVKQSFINTAEIGLLKIATGQSREALKDYQKRYFWSKNNYVNSQVLSVRHFQGEIKAWKQSGKDLKQEIRRIENTPSANKKRKQELFRETRLSLLLKTLIKISEDFTWWQDERKRATYFNIHMGCEILNEVAGRKKYQLDELKYALPDEIEKLLDGNSQPSRKELQARKKLSVLVATQKGYTIKTGREANKIKLLMFDKQQNKSIRDFRGLAASRGKVRGPVKVVKSVTEAGKVKQGDILVAVMTRPDYVMAMKKASAIITNEGGITSHAAIVSRELGIPCIIGTKIATEVLRDGQMVEVNANHGVVTIL